VSPWTPARSERRDVRPSRPTRSDQELPRTSLAATIPEPTITARTAADSRGSSGVPPVLGSGLAEALIIALALGLAEAEALDIGLAEAEDMVLALDMALAEALDEALDIMSSCII
jgi:hypothetical protein